MPAPYDTVISIGGQSLVEGVWRLLGPALERLSNPLPISLPGFSNSVLRIKRITPLFPGTPTTTGSLKLKLAVELNAEALLKINVSAGDFTVQLGQQTLSVTNLTGTIGLPSQSGTLSNIDLVGVAVDGTGNFNLPGGTANFTNGSLSGTLTLPNNLTLPGIPLPAVVPVPVNLTPFGPIDVDASLQLIVNRSGVGSTSTIYPTMLFGLEINTGNVSIGNIALDSALDDNLTVTLNNALAGILEQLNITITQDPPLAVNKVTTLLAPIPGLIRSALNNSLTALFGATGRLVYPPAGPGTSCDVKMLPATCDIRLGDAAVGSYVLQLGFGGRPTSSDIPSFPAYAPTGLADTTIVIGNMFLLELLCCLVERLPAFTFPTASTTSTTDINGTAHVMCCNFTDATVDLGTIALSGGLSICLDGTTAPKRITLVGSFSQREPKASGLPILTLAYIGVSFTLPLAFDLNDVGSLANLRVLGRPAITVTVNPPAGLVAAIIVGGILFIGPAVGTVALLLLYATCQMVEFMLGSAVNTVLRSASLVTSPVAIPSGVFEAFGKLVPVSIVVDDLTADSVLQTPTSPWALLPCNAVPVSTDDVSISTEDRPEIFAWPPGESAPPEL